MNEEEDEQEDEQEDDRPAVRWTSKDHWWRTPTGMIVQWLEDAGIEEWDVGELILATTEDPDNWDFTPTEEEREAAKIHPYSEFGTLFFEREEREAAERKARADAVNLEGLEAQVEYLEVLLGESGARDVVVYELLESFDELDIDEMLRLRRGGEVEIEKAAMKRAKGKKKKA